MNLFVRICCFLSDLLTPSSPPAPIYDLSCIEKHQLLELFKSLRKEDLFGSAVSKFKAVILRWVPHTLYRLKNGEKLEDVSLSIPGNEKRIETDETLTVILDLDMKESKSSSCVAVLDMELNAVFVTAKVEPKHSPPYPFPRIFKIMNSRINLGNDIMYKTMEDQMEDGVVTLTFHKNPENAPPMNIPGLKL